MLITLYFNTFINVLITLFWGVYRAPRASGDLTTAFQKRGMAEVLKVSDP